MRLARRPLACLLLLAWLGACAPRPPASWLGAPTAIAPGVELYRTGDESLVEGIGPIAVNLLRLDPRRVYLASALGNDRIAEAETVAGIAERRHALAAINGGYFNRSNGEPVAVLKVAGQLVSDSSAAKGAVIISAPSSSEMRLVFDRLSAKLTMNCTAGTATWTVPIDGVDTTRARGKLMLYTPAYSRDTGTAPTGIEWVLDGEPLRVVAVRQHAGRTPIPVSGAVLSFGGSEPPPSLAALAPDVQVTFTTNWKSARGVPAAELDHAEHIVNGAGLLRWAGKVVTDWKDEALSVDAFVEARHPRTMIGVDKRGFVWLLAVDGRQPDYSIGMKFSDLQRLADRLELTDALNLDGGGSTTMVAAGRVVNRPSDPTGARPVADAIVVLPR
ncbi:MAG: phosphodiester glycosidase family protein [Vicinamibacterales bacterium]